MDKLVPIKVNEIVSNRYAFFIPSFQRGYKWTRMEVFKLMYDIWDFHINGSKEKGAFYCLQPVVVRPIVYHRQADKQIDQQLGESADNLSEGSVDETKTVYHVIDGQQRLTTILILQYAINRCKNQNEKSYTIDYATRGKSETWLSMIDNEAKMRRNNDYFHIHEAYCAALDFFDWIDSEKEPSPYRLGKTSKECPANFRKPDSIDEFYSCMLNDCRFIWYELDKSEDEDEDEIFKEDSKIFNDFNSGKIPLTNAELVKALLLQTRNFEQYKNDNNQIVSEDYRTNIAHEWDAIEHTLEDERFWNFIYDSSWKLTYNTRIEYILDLLSGKTSKNKDNDMFTFDYFSEQYEKVPGDQKMKFVDEQWRRVKELVSTLQDWYDDRSYYHYIGFLLMRGRKTVNDIVKLQKDEEGNPVNKDVFLERLKSEVRKITSGFKYGDLMKSKRGLSVVLQLFNVLTYLDIPSDNSRFPFHHFKSYSWNEEHVMPNTPFDPKTASSCFQFAAQMLEYFTDISYFDEYDNIESKWRREKRKTKAEVIKNEAVKNLTPSYKKQIDGMVDSKNNPDKHKSLCEDLLKIFEAKGNDCEELGKTCYNELCKEFESSNNPFKPEDVDDRNFIWNIVLLDEGTNKSYGNAIFPYKRKRIIRNESQGVFVPLCTSNVFLKSYSRQMDNMFEWDKTDAINYLAAIIKKLYYKDDRRFLNSDFAEAKEMPDFVNKQYLKKLL